MNAVGIDVSKGKSTVTIRRLVMSLSCLPATFHTQSEINALIEQIKGLDGETKVCMEHTGRYYEPVAAWLSDAGIFPSSENGRTCCHPAGIPCCHGNERRRFHAWSAAYG